MAKATHNGTCQACGRIQAVRADGTIAKHGYTVSGFGYFSGTCSGSDHAPLEVSSRFAAETVELLRRYATQQETKGSGEITEVLVTQFGADADKLRISWSKRPKKFYTREAFEAAKDGSPQYGGWYWDEFVKAERRRLHKDAESARNHIEFLKELIVARSGQPLYKRPA